MEVGSGRELRGRSLSSSSDVDFEGMRDELMTMKKGLAKLLETTAKTPLVDRTGELAGGATSLPRLCPFP